MQTLTLKPGREKSLQRLHPWVFSGAVQKVSGSPAPGETLRLLSAEGQFLAWAAYSPVSQIRARVWSFSEEETIDEAFLRRRLESALRRRAALGAEFSPQPGQALRLVHAESDGLPGFILDWYDGVLVGQFLTAGAEQWRETLADLAMQQLSARAFYERSDADVRQLEGLSPRSGLMRGVLENPRLQIQEDGLRLWVDVAQGHKTGFYLDQRANRIRVGRACARREVLNCFCYTGGFSLHAARAGASSVLSVDTSAEALALAQENAALNQLEGLEWLEADVFTALRKFRDQNRSWDVIILDPPKFAPTAAQAERAARGYKDINRLAFKLLRPGGLLFTFSCSGGIDAALFQKIVASAALDAGTQAQIVEHLWQGADHPVALSFPEGEYLKGLVCQKAD